MEHARRKRITKSAFEVVEETMKVNTLGFYFYPVIMELVLQLLCALYSQLLCNRHDPH